jgi:hypothetical protein
MTQDTSGFYRLNNGKLGHAPNAVRAPTFNLFLADRDTYAYPVDGWYWFDSEAEARAFFNLTDES